MSHEVTFVLHIVTVLGHTPPVPNRNRVPSLFSNAELLHCTRWVWPATPSPPRDFARSCGCYQWFSPLKICFGRNPFRTLVLGVDKSEVIISCKSGWSSDGRYGKPWLSATGFLQRSFFQATGFTQKFHADNKSRFPHPAFTISSIHLHLHPTRINPGIKFGPAIQPARPMHVAIDLLSRRHSLLHWRSSHHTAELLPSNRKIWVSWGKTDDFLHFIHAYSARFMQVSKKNLAVSGILPQNDVSVKDKRGRRTTCESLQGTFVRQQPHRPLWKWDVGDSQT